MKNSSQIREGVALKGISHEDERELIKIFEGKSKIPFIPNFEGNQVLKMIMGRICR
jgi:hypothetical protein